MNLNELSANVAKKTKSLEKAIKDYNNGLKEYELKCVYCNNKQLAKDTLAKQPHYYISPFSCSGGDYWTYEDHSWEYICNSCGRSNKPWWLEYDWDNEKVSTKVKVPNTGFKKNPIPDDLNPWKHFKKCINCYCENHRSTTCSGCKEAGL
jgi:hypothetical protein